MHRDTCRRPPSHSVAQERRLRVLRRQALDPGAPVREDDAHEGIGEGVSRPACARSGLAGCPRAAATSARRHSRSTGLPPGSGLGRARKGRIERQAEVAEHRRLPKDDKFPRRSSRIEDRRAGPRARSSRGVTAARDQGEGRSFIAPTRPPDGRQQGTDGRVGDDLVLAQQLSVELRSAVSCLCRCHS